MFTSVKYEWLLSSRVGVARHRALPICLLVVLLLLVMLIAPVRAFYVPGAAETSYKEGDTVTFMVNALRSSSEMFPIDYSKMPFCQPEKLVRKEESIGEIIWGDRMLNSPYTVEMKKDVSCRPLPKCDFVKKTKDIRERRSRDLTKMIDRWYRVYMSIDNLPVFSNKSISTRMTECAGRMGKDFKSSVQRGFPLGLPAQCTSDGQALLNNHLDFTIHYNIDSHTSPTTTEEDKKYIVVLVEVNARSIAWSDPSECSNKADGPPLALEHSRMLPMSSVMNGSATVYWTYSVTWRNNPDIKWATRWDFFFITATAAAPGSHFVVIVLSLMMVLLIGTTVLGVLLRALHKDFNRYNSEDPEDMREEVGWKLLYADVFRPPLNASWLAIFVANGVQILATASIVLLVALMGFLSPARRGALLTTLLLTASFTSCVGGYVCGRLLQYLNCRAWKHVFTCSLTLPGAILIMYMFILVINKTHGATTAIPFSTLLQVSALCVTVSLPLTVVGSSIAFRQQPFTNPAQVGRLAREIPLQNWNNKPEFMYTFWPSVPLLISLIELYYIMQDLWEGQIYYSFGFLTLTACIWVLLCALVTISTVYYTLCYENHRWWWTAYFVPGGAGVHVFCLSIVFYMTHLSTSSFFSAVVYFAYMSMVSYLYGLAAGAVGVTVTIMFVRVIYSRIKLD